MRSTTELRQHRPTAQRLARGEVAALWPFARHPVKAACGLVRRPVAIQAMSKQDAEREKRLAEALRENLRRRKAQARDAADGGNTPPRED